MRGLHRVSGRLSFSGIDFQRCSIYDAVVCPLLGDILVFCGDIGLDIAT